MEEQNEYEVIIAGGSFAGLSAAMALGRSMRKVLIIDNGTPCNSQTPQAHNLITHDGQNPAQITAMAKEQVLAYSTLSFEQGLVTDITGQNNDFTVITQTHKSFKAKKIILATGLRDILPVGIDGFAACWGISVLHCPYCHGYEIRNRNTGIMANGDMAFEYGRLISHWTKTLTVFTNGRSTLSVEQTLLLKEKNIDIIEKVITGIVHESGFVQQIRFSDDTLFAIEAIYSRPPFEQQTSIPATLGCRFTEAGLIETDDVQQTSVPGIYAAGDNTTLFRSLAGAIAQGNIAGAVLNKEMIHDAW